MRPRHLFILQVMGYGVIVCIILAAVVGMVAL